MLSQNLVFPDILEKIVVKTGVALYMDKHLRNFDQLKIENFARNDLKSIARIVHFISQAYTKERDSRLHSKLERLQYQLGYLLYYFPINFMKTLFLLNKHKGELLHLLHSLHHVAALFPLSGIALRTLPPPPDYSYSAATVHLLVKPP